MVKNNTTKESLTNRLQEAIQTLLRTLITQHTAQKEHPNNEKESRKVDETTESSAE